MQFAVLLTGQTAGAPAGNMVSFFFKRIEFSFLHGVFLNNQKTGGKTDANEPKDNWKMSSPQRY
nr:hypothetical protein [Enterobacter sp. 200527-13]